MMVVFTEPVCPVDKPVYELYETTSKEITFVKNGEGLSNKCPSIYR
jgi:hypothetical protein